MSVLVSHLSPKPLLGNFEKCYRMFITLLVKIPMLRFGNWLLSFIFYVFDNSHRANHDLFKYNLKMTFSTMQGRSQPHSPGWARIPLSSFFLKCWLIYLIFPQTFFLPYFGSPGGRLAHPGRPWLRHCNNALKRCNSTNESIVSLSFS